MTCQVTRVAVREHSTYSTSSVSAISLLLPSHATRHDTALFALHRSVGMVMLSILIVYHRLERVHVQVVCGMPQHSLICPIRTNAW